MNSRIGPRIVLLLNRRQSCTTSVLAVGRRRLMITDALGWWRDFVARQGA